MMDSDGYVLLNDIVRERCWKEMPYSKMKLLIWLCFEMGHVDVNPEILKENPIIVDCPIRAIQESLAHRNNKGRLIYPFIKPIQKDLLYLECRGFIKRSKIEYGTNIFQKKRKKVRKERNKMSTKLRYKIFQRDKFKCQICGTTGEDDKLVIDHIFPISRGGKSKPDNLRILCWTCNSGKRDKIE